MWIVAKIKNNSFNLFRNDIEKSLKNIKIYYPKINYKNSDKNILKDYIFCYHERFKENFHKHFKNYKGLIYFLENNKKSQIDIISFINYCHDHEDSEGYIKNTFFKEDVINFGKFVNGPFANYMFEIASKEKKKIKVLLGNFKINISDNNSILYQKI